MNQAAIVRCALIVTCCTAASFASAADVNVVVGTAQNGSELFEKKIRPILVAECFKCHSTTAEKVKGGLILETRDGMLKGGDTGPALVPGNVTESLMIRAISGVDKELAMPPKKKLGKEVVAAFTQWVQLGAPWPGAGGTSVPPSPAENEKPSAAAAAHYNNLRLELWSWQPIKPGAVPPVKDPKNAAWAKTDIDRFILAKLEDKTLSPSAMADKGTLLRRATFDLTGLPPTPAEVDAFVKDPSAGAFEKVIDRLLASPRFGERWGRHWLDVARYAESTGMARNYVYHYAWRYRNYVIKAFNDDRPYNTFVTEQLAGDLLPYQTPAEHDEHIVATGLLTLGPRDYNEKNKSQFLMDAVDEQIDSMGKAFLAQTVGCARCHDHKFDPIPTAEYYSLAGIFRSTVELPGLDINRPKLSKPTHAALAHLSGFTPEEAKDEGSAADDGQKGKKALKAVLKARYGAETHEAPRHLAMGVRDDAKPADAHILVRGELDQRREIVKRGFISIPCMKEHEPAISANESGRRELAQWITDPANPLTARVYVNRVWAHLFGLGIVKSVDNFGTTGDHPSHPELLDFLADRFQKDGWSTKKLIRQVMLSAAYQQASTFDKAKFTADPENALLWRMNQRRLDAEAIRDAILASAGRLNTTPPIASPALNMPSLNVGKGKQGLGAADLATSNLQRSVYLSVLRGDVPEALEVFDMADPNVVDGSRDVTTVAPQALFMLNDAFVLHQAKAMVERLANTGAVTDITRIDAAYKLTLGRASTPSERERALNFIASAVRDAQARKEEPSKAQSTAWASFCQALFACAEFRYLN